MRPLSMWHLVMPVCTKRNGFMAAARALRRIHSKGPKPATLLAHDPRQIDQGDQHAESTPAKHQNPLPGIYTLAAAVQDAMQCLSQQLTLNRISVRAGVASVYCCYRPIIKRFRRRPEETLSPNTAEWSTRSQHIAESH